MADIFRQGSGFNCRSLYERVRGSRCE